MKLPRFRRAPTVHELIRRHYEKVWGKNRVEEVHWTPGHMSARLPNFHIARVPPTEANGMWTYATIGAWEATQDEEHCLEFVAVDRSGGSRIMENLMLLAWYHAGPPENRLGVGHTVPKGEPWVEGSPMDYTLISLPYLWGPTLEHLDAGERHIQVLWALPIYEVESDFRAAFGLEALESRFEERLPSDFYLDPQRPSVVSVGEAPRLSLDEQAEE